MGNGHIPVLLKEVMEALRPAKDRRLLDATFGRGGHSRAMLSAGAEVVALDQDQAAAPAAESLRAEFPDHFTFIQTNFSSLADINQRYGHFDAILFDLGVSSPQFDTAERGFSFQFDGPLDMRMNQHIAMSAAELVATASEAELADIIRRFGEESRARTIARAIVAARQQEPITRTGQLAALVERAVGGRRGAKIHPATKTFQALRIAINDELGVLQTALAAVPQALNLHGRLGVISFHALEDRIVKEFIVRHSTAELRSEQYAFGRSNPDYCLQKIGRWMPTEEEIKANPRARSARLRVAEKIK